jgi:Carboxypeptidase regulatory-like domain
MLKRISCLLACAILATSFIFSQVTTSSITGTVKDNKDQPLVGATITAKHTPSGTVYTTISSKNGVFTFPNVRIGGPYQIKIDFVGLKSETLDGINLLLGEPYNVNVVLGENVQIMENVIVTGRTRRAATDKTGASTNISNRQITTLPTISRSITDFTRLTPQANGNSFAGRDGRFNNVTIDGANLNNNFGLSSDALPGSGNPISLDAIEEISVNIAPFDVRQSNFTGAGISAVTKSGTNTFHGSAYGYYRDQTFNGTNVGKIKLPAQQNQKNTIYGATLSGPIIKNKLFFFLSAESEKRTFPGIQFIPTGGAGAGNVSIVPVDSLKKVSDYLNSKYGFDPGPYDNFPNFSQKNHKILGKIDWNISNSHKLTLKYSDYVQTIDNLISQSGGINGANSTGLVTYGPRFSSTAMSFAHVNYITEDIVRSGTLELNSKFSKKVANQFLATVTKIRSTKSHEGGTFPFVDILGPPPSFTKNNYISLGNEPFNGNNNDVINDIYNVTDNFSYFTGKHTFTAGASYEFQRVGNMFMAGSQGYYAYGSIDDFVNDRAPKIFSITYSLTPGQDAVYSANLKIGQLGGYVQDEINFNPRMRVTLGLRVDKPIYPEQPLENPAISALNLYNHDGVLTHYTTGKWPQSELYWSPRIGFRWDMQGDKSVIIRGGTGIFTGRIPFVYLTNVPSNSGMYQAGVLVTTNMQNFLFSPDAKAYNPFYNHSLNPAVFPVTAGTIVPSGSYAITSGNFKFPQVWRTNIALDKQLSKTWSMTLEALYTNDINAVYMFNANQKSPDTVVVTGAVSRPRFSSAAARKLNAASGNAIVLDNTHLGSSFTFTALLNKSFSRHLYGTVAYTYTFAIDVTANPGSQANSVWSANATSRTQNDLELAYSNFAVPHRFVGSLSYRFEYLKHLASNISFFYEATSAGTYSYIYNGDLNNDGNSADLIYIPKNASEINFKNGVVINGVSYTSKQQSDLFFQYVDQDPYLKRHKGQVAERNGAKFPWYHRLDMKFTQEIFTSIKNHRNTLQFTADVINFPNLINKEWGIRKLLTSSTPLRVESVTGGIPTFSLGTYQNAPLTKTFDDVTTTSSTWGIQLGLRYIF